MKILIVSVFFPPENAIASLRPYSWAKYWSQAGHDVTVLTTTKEKRKNNLKLDCSSFNVIETPVPIFSFLNRCNTKVIESEEFSGKPLKKTEKTISVKILAVLKAIYLRFIHATGCFGACRYPDLHDLWIRKAFHHLDPGYFDFLVTTGGPYSVHRIGLFLKKKGWKGSWICDWRDLWTKNHLFPGLAIFRPWEKHLEKVFHDSADYITTVSKPLADILRTMTKTPVEVIYNGFDEDDFKFLFSRIRKENKKYTISYLGTIYRGYQDPSAIFKALGELDRECLITPEDIEILFAGPQTDVLDLVQKYGVEKYYRFLGFLPREQALELQYDSDAVLFLEYDNPKIRGILTGKIFEYLYIAREIIAVGCTNKISAGELIEKCNAGICFGHDVEKIKAYILNAIKNKKNGIVQESGLKKNMEEINRFSRKLQAEKMLSFVL